MKSIKTISYQSRDNKPSSLPTIAGQPALKSKRQKIQAPCAFHPAETITNFCKCTSCFLPLCPKCVKIHMEEHFHLGTAAKFQSVDDCLDEAHQYILSTFSQASSLQKTSLEIEQNYIAKKQCTLKQFEKIKLHAFEYLSDVFKTYQQALRLQISKEDKIFTENLIEYHDMMGVMMETCRNSTKKFNNKNTVMEGLIGFYSKSQYSLLLKECEDKLKKMSITKLEIMSKPEELQDLQLIIKRYLVIGDSKTSFQKLLTENRFYKEVQTEPSSKRISFTKNAKNSNDPSAESALTSTNFVKMITLLDNFSLERSRNTRISLEKNTVQ